MFGADLATRSVMGLGTGQRNLSAALVVAAQNFGNDPDVLVMIMVVAIIGLILLMVIGGELGRRDQAEAALLDSRLADAEAALTALVVLVEGGFVERDPAAG